MKRIALILTALLLITALAGCAAKSADTMAASPMAAPEAMPYASDKSYDAAEMGGEYYDYALAGEAESPAALAPNPTTEERYGGRKIIRNYELYISTESFDEHLAGINERLAEFGGYAQSSTVDGKKPEVYGDRGRNAYLVLRVPADRADEFITGVKAFGTVTNSYDYCDDITDAYFDTDTRLEVLNVQLERLQSILVETDNLADVIALENRISEVMLEIEDLTGTLKKYDALVYYATVTINLSEETLKAGPAATKTTGERISEGFSNSLYGIGTFFTDLAVWFVSSLPVLLILAIVFSAIFFPIRAASRRNSKKRAERMAEAAVRQQALFAQKKAEYEASLAENANKQNPEQGDSK